MFAVVAEFLESLVSNLSLYGRGLMGFLVSLPLILKIVWVWGQVMRDREYKDVLTKMKEIADKNKNILPLFLLIFLFSCSSLPLEKLNPNTIYKRDMILDIDGNIGEGTLVVPLKDKITFHVTAQGDLDLFTFTSCHREETVESAWNVTETTGKIFKKTIDKKREIIMDYSPTAIEKKGGCPIFLGGYEQEKGRHSWGMVDFETDEAKLPALVYCNGREINSRGVSVCQSKEGLIQGIKFSVSVKVSPDSGCELDKKEGSYFEFPIHRGQCVYAFMSKEGSIHRLTTLGYELVPIRK